MKPDAQHFSKLDPSLPAVCFTFDDNLSRHREMIAPAFFERGWRCTFYINPGTSDFASHMAGYKALLEQGFEIGSHGDVHDNLSELEPAAALENMQKAAQRIQAIFGVYPSTFAFPYHDYNEKTLMLAKSLYLETRNTLADSIWFAIKTAIPLSDMLTAVEQAISEKRPLVFSGHSVIKTREEATDESQKHETGSNPILLSDLCELLDFIASKGEHVQVLTFEQAALLACIKQYSEIDGNSYILTQQLMDHLSQFHIDASRLNHLI